MQEPDLIPAGVVSCTADALIVAVNSRLLEWLGMNDATPLLGRPFHTILAPAGKIYFETHLRPMLLVEGRFSEISLQLRPDEGPDRRVYLNGQVETDTDGSVSALHFACFEGEARFRYEQELIAERRKAEQYRALVNASPDAIINIDTDLRIDAWNAAAERLLGYSEAEALGRPAHPLIFADDQTASVRGAFDSLNEHVALTFDTTSRHATGEVIPVSLSVSRLADEFGTTVGMVGILRDVRDRIRNEMLLDSLNREIMHRSKNQIAVIQAIARSTARGGDPARFLDTFVARLNALARNLSLLSERRYERIGLKELIRQQLTHLDGKLNAQIDLTGDDADIAPDVAEAVGMAIFELSTNAAKYGALSERFGETGRLSIHIEVDHATETGLHIDWKETGGHGVEAPTDLGFGSQLTGKLLERVSGGTVTADYSPAGLHWHLSAPISLEERATVAGAR